MPYSDQLCAILQHPWIALESRTWRQQGWCVQSKLIVKNSRSLGSGQLPVFISQGYHSALLPEDLVRQL